MGLSLTTGSVIWNYIDMLFIYLDNNSLIFVVPNECLQVLMFINFRLMFVNFIRS